MALEAFKILSNQIPVDLSDLLTFKSHSYSFRYMNTVEVPQVRTSKYGVRSFRSAAVKMWNSLPQQFREINTVEQFRSWSEGGGGSAHSHSVLTVKFYIDLNLTVHFSY